MTHLPTSAVWFILRTYLALLVLGIYLPVVEIHQCWGIHHPCLDFSHIWAHSFAYFCCLSRLPQLYIQEKSAHKRPTLN